MKKVILHLCADIGSDSYPYACDPDYRVILIGKDYGVENLTKSKLLSDFGVNAVHGIIANPVCTDLSRARHGGKAKDIEKGLFLVRECQRIIEELQPKWWVIENPASGVLRDYLGKPALVYQPYEYGSGWTKKTALWGNFTPPVKNILALTTVQKFKACIYEKNETKPRVWSINTKIIFDLLTSSHLFRQPVIQTQI